MTGHARFGHGIAAMALAVLAMPSLAAAQLDCGSHTERLTIRQAPNYARAVEVLAVTSRSFSVCPIELQTEAWVEGSGSVVTARGVYTAEVKFTKPVSSYGTWRATSKHWSIWLPATWVFLGTHWAQTTIVAPPSPPSVCLLTAEDCPEGTSFLATQCICKTNSPILVDVAGDGYRLTDAEGGVDFDLDGNGVAERLAWTEADSDDAWLVLDRSGNGAIDGGAELFGNKTPVYADAAEPTAEHGFYALLNLEGPTYGPAVVDASIDRADSVFGRLRLWTDRNHNGVSEPDELVPLEAVGLIALDTRFQESHRQDSHGNVFALSASSSWRTASGAVVRRRVHDVYLTVRGMPTRGHRPVGPQAP
jgi:hypothetical protein